MEGDFLNSWIVGCLASLQEISYAQQILSYLLALLYLLSVALKFRNVCGLTLQFHPITCWPCYCAISNFITAVQKW